MKNFKKQDLTIKTNTMRELTANEIGQVAGGTEYTTPTNTYTIPGTSAFTAPTGATGFTGPSGPTGFTGPTGPGGFTGGSNGPDCNTTVGETIPQ